MCGELVYIWSITFVGWCNGLEGVLMLSKFSWGSMPLNPPREVAALRLQLIITPPFGQNARCAFSSCGEACMFNQKRCEFGSWCCNPYRKNTWRTNIRSHLGRPLGTKHLYGSSSFWQGFQPQILQGNDKQTCQYTVLTAL